MNPDKVIGCIIAEDFLELNQIYCSILNHEATINVLASVSSGSELVKAVEMYHPDVILMDIEMESQNAGIDYCRLISQRFPDIRIVILTCHEEEERILAAFEAGAVDYLLKTDSMSDIIASIKNAYFRTSPIHSHAASALRKKMKELGSYKEALQQFTRAFMTLTPAETGVLKMLLKGMKQREIASKKCIELVTVKTHVGRILKKFEMQRTSEVLTIIQTLDVSDFVDQAKSI
ncbi:MAG: response regulator transcription factor [Sphaerochaeta sp.]|nr:response regulator transcription factor [Sphaerochaeta sp.]